MTSACRMPPAAAEDATHDFHDGQFVVLAAHYFIAASAEEEKASVDGQRDMPLARNSSAAWSAATTLLVPRRWPKKWTKMPRCDDDRPPPAIATTPPCHAIRAHCHDKARRRPSWLARCRQRRAAATLKRRHIQAAAERTPIRRRRGFMRDAAAISMRHAAAAAPGRPFHALPPTAHAARRFSSRHRPPLAAGVTVSQPAVVVVAVKARVVTVAEWSRPPHDMRSSATP